MDTSRANRLKKMLELPSWKDTNQKQFNDLVTNLSSLDKETVREIIKQIPDLSSKVLNYFKEVSLATGVKHRDYLDAMQKHNELLCKWLEKEEDPQIRNKIADSLLEHSQWLRKEATQTRIFKSTITMIGMGVAFCLVKNIMPFKLPVANMIKESGIIREM